MAELISSGDVDARKIMLGIVERPLQELDSYYKLEKFCIQVF